MLRSRSCDVSSNVNVMAEFLYLVIALFLARTLVARNELLHPFLKIGDLATLAFDIGGQLIVVVLHSPNKSLKIKVVRLAGSDCNYQQIVSRP